MTSPRKSQSTLQRMERAAMRWFKVSGGFFFGEGNIVNNHLLARKLEAACAAHAAAKDKREKKHAT